MQKSVAFLYTNNEQNEKKHRKSNPLTISSKKKYLGINLTKKVKDLYNENCKSLKKQFKENYRSWKISPANGLAESI
jgi:hypothetical protein